MPTYEKECVICGAFFTAKRSNRLYCDKCQKHPENRTKEYSDAVKISKHRMNDAYIPTEFSCAFCGKTFTGPRKLGDPGGFHYPPCCSKECEERYRESKKTCEFCGKLLHDGQILSEKYRNLHMGCEEPYEIKEDAQKVKTTLCRYCQKRLYDGRLLSEKHQYVHADCEKEFENTPHLVLNVSEKQAATCPCCGKPVIKKFWSKQSFCNRECYDTWRKKNKGFAVDGTQLVSGDIERTCKWCGKKFVVHRKYPTNPNRITRFCSKECDDAHAIDMVKKQQDRRLAESHGFNVRKPASNEIDFEKASEIARKIRERELERKSGSVHRMQSET